MEIKDIKELKALIQMCRKQGITKFTCGDFTCELGPLPQRPSTHAEEQEEGYQGETLEESKIDELVGMPINPSDEELMNWAHPMQTEGSEQ